MKSFHEAPTGRFVLPSPLVLNRVIKFEKPESIRSEHIYNPPTRRVQERLAGPYLLGVHLGPIYPVVVGCGSDSIEAAQKLRMLKLSPTPSSHAIDLVRQRYLAIRETFPAIVMLSQFDYVMAMDSSKREGVREALAERSRNYGRSRFDVFVKFEKLTDKVSRDPFHLEAPPSVKPRPIQFKGQRNNARCGLTIQSIYHSAKRCLNGANGLYFAAGRTAGEIGGWIDGLAVLLDAGWVFATNDCTSYDSTHHASYLRFFADFVRQTTSDELAATDIEEDVWFLSTAADGSSVAGNGTMRSGLPYTTLANTVLNLAAHASVLANLEWSTACITTSQRLVTTRCSWCTPTTSQARPE